MNERPLRCAYHLLQGCICQVAYLDGHDTEDCVRQHIILRAERLLCLSTSLGEHGTEVPDVLQKPDPVRVLQSIEAVLRESFLGMPDELDCVVVWPSIC
jgi:hypothetical protein